MGDILTGVSGAEAATAMIAAAAIIALVGFTKWGAKEGCKLLRLMVVRAGRRFGVALSFWGGAMIILLFCGFMGALCGWAGVKGLDA